VLGHAARIIGAGMAIGLTVAMVAAQTLGAFLFAIRPWDPFTFGAVAVVLALTALAACTAPARRALRVDPAQAFHSE
jgi:ABC-type antimicrobial peptide transport system permease subunit